jgi:hypothetical protein
VRQSRLRLQAGDSSAGVVAIFAIVVIVLLLILAYYGFFGGGHWFGTGAPNTTNVNVSVAASSSP